MRYSSFWKALFAPALLILLSSSVFAATVNTLNPAISINRGNGFAPVGAGTTAHPGDMVMASPSGSAEIIYDDGCREKVDPGSVVTVAATSPCKAAEIHPGWVAGGLLVAGGIAAGVILSNDDGPNSP